MPSILKSRRMNSANTYKIPRAKNVQNIRKAPTASSLSQKNESTQNSQTRAQAATTRSEPRRASEPSQALAQGSETLRSVLMWSAGILLVILLFFTLGAGLLKLYHTSISSDFFNINEIVINGNQHFSTEEAIALSGLQIGENSLAVRITDIEQKFIQSSWIEKVSIKRSLPDTFTIDIVERVPRFWILKNGTLHYLDSRGRLIAPVESGNFLSLPTLDIGLGGQEALPELDNFLDGIVLADLPFDLSQISWLRVSAARGFELYWESKNLSLCIGIEDWQQNLKRLGSAIRDMEKRNEISAMKEFHAADGQVWIERR